jgi:hypothetical protein
MPRLSKRPRSKGFFRTSKNSIVLEFVTLTAKSKIPLSQNVIKVFKSLRKRSFYKAIEIASSIENTIERNEILQILYSAIVYSENNHYANLLKLCIDDIYIVKISKFNQFIPNDSLNFKERYNVVIQLAFEYKEPPIKKESIW